MTIQYYLAAANSDLSDASTIFNYSLLRPGAPQTTSSVTLSARPLNSQVAAFFTVADDPGTNGSATGTIVAHVNATTLDSGMSYKVIGLHLDSAGNQLDQTGGGSSNVATTGVSAITLPTWNNGTAWSTGDRLEFRITATNNNTKGGSNSIVIEINNIANTIDTPFGAAGPTTVNKSASDAAAISTTSTISTSSTGSTSDSSTIASTSIASVASTGTTSDTGAVSVAESSAVSIIKTISTTDGGSVAVTDSSSTSVTTTLNPVASTDTGSVSVSEASSVIATVQINASDTTVVAASETDRLSTTDTGYTGGGGGTGNINYVTSSSGQTASASTTHTVPLPWTQDANTGLTASAGDLAIVMYVLPSGSTSSETITADPSGWTVGTSQQGTTLTAITYMKTLVAGEPDPTITVSASASCDYVVHIYRGVDPTIPFIDRNMLFDTSSTATVSTPILNNTNANAWAVTMFGARQCPTPASWTPPIGFIEHQDFDSGRSGNGNVCVSGDDSGGPVPTGNVSYTGTLNQVSTLKVAWMGILNPAGTAATNVTINGTDSGAIGVSDSSSNSVQSASTPVSTTDTGAVGVTEASSVAVTFSAISANDASTLGVVDTSSTIATLSRTDVGAVSVVDTSATLKTFTSTDQAAVSVSDISSIGSSSPGQENISVSVTDTSQISVTLNTADTGAISVADVSSTLVIQSRSDQSAVSASESRTIAVTLASTDTGAVATSDSSAISGSATISANDTNGVAISETPTIAVDINTNDTSSVAASDTSSSFKTLASSDAGAVTITAISGIGSTLPGQESTGLGVTDTSSIFTDQPTSESVSLSVSEAVDIYVTVSTSDAVGIGVNYQAAVQLGFSTTDTGGIAVTESSVTDISGTLIKASTDIGVLAGEENAQEFIAFGGDDAGALAAESITGQSGNGGVTSNDEVAVSVDEAIDLFKVIDGSDTVAVSVDESTAFGIVSFTSVDSGSVVVSENATVWEDQPRSDTGSITVDETSSVTVSGGTDHTGSDSAAIGTDEVSDVFIAVTANDAGRVEISEALDFAPIAFGSTDSLQIIAIDASGFAPTARTAADGGVLAVNESSALEVTAQSITSTDTGSLVTDEATSGFLAVSAAETNSLRVAESTEFIRTIRGSETVAVSTTEQAGTFETIETTDTIGLGLTDTSVANKAEGFVAMVGNDGVSISVIDHSGNWIVGGKHIPIVFASNSEHGTIISTEAEHGDMHFNSGSERVIRFE